MARNAASTLLNEESFTVVTAVEAGEVVDVSTSFQPGVVVLEVPTPNAHVIQMCTMIRAASTTPVIVLSGPCPERDAVAAFGAGADSVITELIGSHELVARVRALLRRVPDQPEAPDDLVVVGPIVLDRARRELTVAGERVPVPRREFEIAELLMREAGRVVPRPVLVRELWGSMRDTKSLDVQVGRLRARLSAASGRACIVTVRGVGFRFASDGEFAEASADDVDIDLIGLESPGDVVSRARSAEAS